MTLGWNYRDPPRLYRSDSDPEPRRYEGVRAQKRAKTNKSRHNQCKHPKTASSFAALWQQQF
eukprot:7996152-Lingulodinium_polyedra.AAC.1